MELVTGVIFLLGLHLSLSLTQEKFYAAFLCDLDKRMNRNCSKVITGVDTWRECVFECSNDFLCVGVGWKYTGPAKKRCFHHFSCNVSGCDHKEEGYKYKAKNCAHGGVWNPDKFRCSCRNGWIGESCLDLPKKCSDLHPFQNYRTHLNLSASGVRDPVPVRCCKLRKRYYDGIGVLKNRGRMIFNQTWEEYRRGFYVDRQNYWIGLDKWHTLSKAGYSDLIIRPVLGNGLRLYSAFSLRNESNKFSFKFENSYDLPRGGNKIGDCLGPLQNKPFSTSDADNDGVKGGNCAATVGIGWWFGENCSLDCNLAGMPPWTWERINENQRFSLKGIDPEIVRGWNDSFGVVIVLNKPGP